MYVSVIHDISDPGQFWGTVEGTEPPEGVTRGRLPVVTASRSAD